MQPDRAAKRTDGNNATDMSKHDFEARSRKFCCQLLFRSGVWSEGAVAFVKISARTYTTDLHRLSPRSCSEIFLRFDCVRFRFPSSGDLIDANHCFGQNSAIHFLGRLNSKNVQNCRRNIDIACGQIVRLTATKIGTRCDQSIMHVESAERSVSSFPCFALPISVDHSRSAKLIF